MSDTTSDAPRYLHRDTYTGRHRMTVRAPYRVTAWKASELAEMAAEGVIWERFTKSEGGKVARSRYVADADGNLHMYDHFGGKTIIHPADRVLHILVK